MIKWIFTGLFMNLAVMRPAKASSDIPAADIEHSTNGMWYWLAYAAAILIFGFVIYILSGARMKRRMTRLQITLSDELAKIDALLAAKRLSEVTEERAGTEAENRIRRLSDLKARIESDVAAMSQTNISVINLPALSQAIQHYSVEKYSIHEHLKVEEGMIDQIP